MTRATGYAFESAAERWSALFSQQIKLVLHAGTPKTGTKALQHSLYERADALRAAGVLYPMAGLDMRHKKHQFLVDLLLSGDEVELIRAFDAIVDAAPLQTRIIVLSTEGLFNHWWDFPQESKALLRHLRVAFDVEVWACFREPLAFAVSQYAQLLRNPRQFSPAYGLDASLDEMLKNEWFIKRLNYLGFVQEVEEVMGCSRLRAFRYGSDIVERIFAALGQTLEPGSPRHVNPSLRASGVELMRIVNRYDLSAEKKEAAAALVLETDILIGDRGGPLRASPEAARLIDELTASGWVAVQNLFPATDPAFAL